MSNDQHMVTVPVELVRDLAWMARRYCDGRASYAPSTFNGHTRTLLSLGVPLNPTGDETIWARNSYGRGSDGFNDDEAARGRAPDWWHSGPDAREQIDALQARIAELTTALESLNRAAEWVTEAIDQMLDSGTEWPTGLHKGSFIDLISETEQARAALGEADGDER